MNTLNFELLRTALGEYGQAEIKGSRHNDRVLEYFAKAGFSGIKTDEVAWCAAFANWVLHQNGLEKSGKLSARSLLRVGSKVTEPIAGDLVIFWRESRSSWKGHVGFYVGETDRHILTLGGNQSNRVSIAKYSKSRVLGYRRLRLADGIIKACACDKLPIDESLKASNLFVDRGLKLTAELVFADSISTQEAKDYVDKVQSQVAEQLKIQIEAKRWRYLLGGSPSLEAVAKYSFSEVKNFYAKHSTNTENFTIFVLDNKSKLEGLTKHYVNSLFVARGSESEYSSTIAHNTAHLLGLSDNADLTRQEKNDFGVKGELEKFNLMSNSIYGKALSSEQLGYLHNYVVKHFLS